jgi:uncharacterized protein (TIGR02118 family)
MVIHQLIFAYPKPGMSEAEFQAYWLEVHAPQYAAKIPQIRKYLIDTRIPRPGEAGDHLWSGVAEIWLANEREQLESLQTPEFLEGARLDEPRWAAFWRSVVLDTDAHVLREPATYSGPERGVKLIRLLKRRQGTGLAEFRERSLRHAETLLELPGLHGLVLGHTRDGYYGVGEAVLDGALQLWFDDLEALDAALASAAHERARQDLHAFAEPRYVHELTVSEHWVIGPAAR